MRRATRFSTLALLAVLAAAVAARGEGVGEVSFANSGAAAAQPAFLRGLALLHNFEYDDAAASFREAQKLAPGFAMAYWGEAMTHTHPVWLQQDRDAALAALAKLAPTAAERQAKAPTDRERAWLSAVEVLYGEGAKEQRDRDYASAMEALHARFPDDVDAAAFHALALLGTAHQGRDFATYMRAAAVLEEVFPAHPHHPGVLHYLIHCYDDAVHAPLGVRAARLYGAVAPDAGHALHMTSHIFIALGQWGDVIAANEQAMRVVNAQRAVKKQDPKNCGHYPDWLHYGLLQRGQLAEAEAGLERCRQDALAEAAKPDVAPDPRYSAIGAWSEMRLQFVVDAGKVPGGSIEVPADARYADARLNLAYADLYAAVRDGDAKVVKSATERFASARKEVEARHDAEDPLADEEVAALGQQIDALVLLASGQRAPALEALARAADAEDAIPLVFGPPLVEKPSRELLGEQLVAAGRVEDGKAALIVALARNPGRTAALRALLAAQTALHDEAGANATRAAIAANVQPSAAVAPSAASPR